ncbi:AraC family transcriptional regulator [Haloactinopolyspora alba]|uniref:AraC family transcriptional regulator n=1 Tax=Haloactinopolyspora alba TaxID=648780 RepID=A0A2P8E996_9ACTN|nr:helix-turn-helix domain-containing protein [Haloactinopolyspora alba]PSL06053.1 AraC family transcriptional regulator [Haloactinopolyspora alba]
MTLFRSPVPALAPFVDVLWYVDERLPPGRERRLPNGSMQLVVNLADDVVHWYDGVGLDVAHNVHGAALCGAVTGPVGIDTADRAVGAGVVFRPGGAVPFFAPPASALTEPVVALDALWGRTGATMRESLLEQPTPNGVLATLERALLARVVRPLEPDRSVARAAAALDRGAPVAAVADDLGVVASTLHRRFSESVGLAPKSYARVRRLQRVLRHVGDDGATDWAGAAAVHGFVDQAHLVNDFRRLTGLTPGRYRPRSAGEHNHVPLGRA